MNTGNVELLEYASFIVAALAGIVAIVSIFFVIASFVGVVWVKKIAEDVAQKTAEDVARKIAQEAVEKGISSENIEIMVKDAAKKAASIAGESLYQAMKKDKKVVSTKEETND